MIFYPQNLFLDTEAAGNESIGPIENRVVLEYAATDNLILSQSLEQENGQHHKETQQPESVVDKQWCNYVYLLL